jgi:hypothetical protein
VTVAEQVNQIQKKLRERTMGSQLPVDRVDAPCWLDLPRERVTLRWGYLTERQGH